MPSKGVMAEIRRLLNEGNTKRDLIAAGYARGSVYSAARQLAKDGRRSLPDSRIATSDTQTKFPQPSSSSAGDEQITELQRAIQTAKLQNELAKLRGEAVSAEDLKAMVYRLQEWVVRNFCDMGQCLVRLQGEDPNAEEFQAFVRESLQELRGS